MRSGIVTQLIVVVLCAGAAFGQPEHVFYVDAAAVGAGDGSSWADAFPHLQDALAAASAVEPPVEIRVAQGVYKPDQGAGVTPGDVLVAFQLFGGLTLRGGYGGVTSADPDAWDVDLYETVLSADLSEDDNTDEWKIPENSAIVVDAQLTTESVTVEGVTVTGAGWAGMSLRGGRQTVRQCCFVGNHGKGLRVLDANAPALVECRFNANRDGMELYANDAVLTGCTFEGSQFRGLESMSAASATLTDCRFIANGWGGVRGWGSDFTLRRCVFHGNGGDGIDASGHVIARDCTFTDNADEAVDGGTVDLLRCVFTGNNQAVHSSKNLLARSCAFTDNDGVGQVVKGWGDTTLVDCQFVDNAAIRHPRWPGAVKALGETLTVRRCLFSGNVGKGDSPGAIESWAEVTRLSNCLFVGNLCPGEGPGAVLCLGEYLRMSNCTFADNRGQPNTLDLRSGANRSSQLIQCIVWDGPDWLALPSWEPGEFAVGYHHHHGGYSQLGNVIMSPPLEPSEFTVTYSNVQGGYPGEGNVFVDPCFVSPGYWADLYEAAPDEPNAVWVAGDYHLKSQAGHWDVAEGEWVLDDVTSPCIDLGDPNGPLGVEPFPNGGYVNLGAYGGTAEASRSYFGEPVCETHIAGDINGDCRVDDLDMDILLSHWLMEDIGRANVPPTITIVSPQDGAELSGPEPLALRFEASDPDGRILLVEYRLIHDHGTGLYSTWRWNSVGPAEGGWEGEYNLSRLNYDGLYVLRAEAMDDDGAKAVAEITITLHR